MTTNAGIEGAGVPVRSSRALGAVVRARRLEIGLSQTSLASRADVSRQWLSFVESGKPTVELGRVLQVLEALGLDLRVHRASAGTPAPVDLDALLDEHRRGG